MAEDGKIAPQATTIEQWQHTPDYKDAAWALAQIDISAFLGKTEKATITLPKLLMIRIDEFVKKEGNPTGPAIITTVHGVDYRFELNG